MLGDGALPNIVRQVIDDITSRGALAGAISLFAIVLAVCAWWIWTSRVQRACQSAQYTVLVTGSRGKSSTVRMLHSVMSTAGIPTYAKVTGTAAAEIDEEAIESPTIRVGQVSVLEMFTTMAQAGKHHVQGIVMECMAVTPSLISLIADRILRPNIVVITNAELDHLEEEGTSREEIAASLAKAITPGALVVTGEGSPEALGVIERLAAEIGAQEVVVATAAGVPSEILAKLPYAHPQNIAIVLAIAGHIGIDAATAVRGLIETSREPGEYELWSRDVGRFTATYLDFGAINDPRSLTQVMEKYRWPLGQRVPRIGVVTGRWDRPLRALEFGGFMQPEFFDGVILAGGPVYAVRTELVRAGWQPERVIVAVQLKWSKRMLVKRLTRLANAINPEATEIMLVGLENEHEPFANFVRRYFHKGTHRGLAWAS